MLRYPAKGATAEQSTTDGEAWSPRVTTRIEKIEETARARARVQIPFWRSPARPMRPSACSFPDLRANIAAMMAIGQYQINLPLTFYPSSGYLIKTSYFDSLCSPDIYMVLVNCDIVTL